ncbi:MAG: 6-phosphogluconate dehydrogenase [Limisphaerales bacterium]|nr:MAG: 6-phosphogluconate dehydrogenase [Limisphaerales bacterium]KAG0510053.1 MAG: 6-phosphogluconate dehydrogenase [Limisphaerales bacterium]TXT52896.1 MAG: 6-phosphogluconate dehydrogenase [Limisphaerales bacterium]
MKTNSKTVRRKSPHMVRTRRAGLIGLGLMGAAFAQRLRAAGWEVLGFDLSPACRRRARSLGVQLARDAAEVFAGCDRVVLSLPTLRETETVLAEAKRALRPGHLLLDTTTGEPAQTVAIHRRLAARGVRYLDTTISGNSGQVAAGDDVLTMVGGDADAFAAARGLLRALTPRVRHVGPSGSGARMKLVTNLVLGLNRAALAEGLCFAERLGFTRRAALEVLLASKAYSTIMDTKGEKMVTEDFTPQARLSQHLKDVRLMLKAARAARFRLPFTRVHRQLLEAAERAGLGALDNSALIKVLAGSTKKR